VKYDENNNRIHYKDSYGKEYWAEYDENNNIIHSKDSNGDEYWVEYDENNNMIHSKYSNGDEYWFDSNEKIIPNPNLKSESLNINIRKYTQLDLLDEGFWKALGKGIAATARATVPELTNPIDKTVNTVKGIGNAIKQGWQGEQGTIKKNLEDQGYKVGEMTKVGKNWKVKVQEMTIDPATGNEIPTGPEIFKIVTPEKTIRTQPQAGSRTSPQALYQYGGKYYAPDLSKAPVPRGSGWEIPGYQVDANNSRISNRQNIIIVDRNHVVSNVR
jgi:YD repeat-containing protein